MEPRWMVKWLNNQDGTPSSRPHCVFLGGTNDFDLWVDADTDLRIVCGETGREWDYYHQTDNGDLIRVSEEMDITDEQFKEVLRYLALFAPDWRERAPRWMFDDEL